MLQNALAGHLQAQPQATQEDLKTFSVRNKLFLFSVPLAESRRTEPEQSTTCLSRERAGAGGIDNRCALEARALLGLRVVVS